MSGPPHPALDRSSPMPLWAQLATELRARIEAGEFAERFPTDLELTTTYGVSRHTARHAVAELNKDGLLRRARGVGTVLNQAEFEQSVGSLYSLFRAVEDTGVEQRSTVRELAVVRDGIAAQALELAPTARLVHLARIRFAGDAPLAIDEVWLPYGLGEALLKVDFGHTALYDEMERATGQRPTSGWERIMPVVPTEAERELLDLGPNDAAFSVERLGKLGPKPIEWRRTLIRGDRFRFVTEWSAGTKAPLRLQAVDSQLS
jgi:GntR family transcriptional regulator